MKSKLLSVILIMMLLLTSAVCSYAANNIPSGDSVITASSGQSNSGEKIKNQNKNDDSDAAAKEERIKEKKEQIRNEYTEEEMEVVNAAAEKIKKEDPDTKVLGSDSVISDTAKFKFDTPPVIKGGRTLIPVRAITEGLGAELSYNQETKVVTITKGDTVIELTLGSTTAIVNGEEVQLDTNASIVNNRTYVPLRFVMETFKLNVEWDKDTETIEITEGTDETASGGAITTDDL